MNTLSIHAAAPALIAALCLLPTVGGCQSRSGNDGAQAMSGESPNSLDHRVSASHAAFGPSLTTAMLTDASFRGMQATQVAAPKGWQIQGRVDNPPCTTNLRFASWDATSPNGQSQMNLLPAFGWRWGIGSQDHAGCIPLSGPVQAAGFLQKFAARLRGVRVVGDLPTSDAFRSRAENFTNMFNGINSHVSPQLQARNTGDVAAIQAVDATGHEMRLRAWVQCAEYPRGPMQGGSCFAKVDVLRAPKGELNALVSLVDSHNLVQDHPTEEYKAAYGNRQAELLRRNQDASDARLAQQRRNNDAASRMLHDQYVSSSERLNAQHQAFMQQMQSSTDSSMRNTNNSMNARTTAASDMQDYSLNQQTVTGANGTYKTSSQYSNVWSSPVAPALSDGRTFGSTDNAIDPNTATDNTWTKDTKVHGNGQPY